MAATAISGTAFGAVLAYSGVWQPDVIIQQLQLQDFSMVQVFVTASAASAVAVLFTTTTKIAEVKARPTSTIGLFPYDANILGGSLVGLGMALSGACPGTVLVQVVNGMSSGYYAVAGCLLGATVYAAVADIYQGRSGKPIIRTSPGSTISSPSSHSTVLVGYAAACAGAAFLLRQTGYSKLLQDVALSGGLAIGGAQLLSLLLRRATVGISSGYGAVGDWFWSLLDSKSRIRSINWQPLIFIAGVMAGSCLILNSVSSAGASHFAVAPLQALLGGISLAMGARIGGGCTSGHGISGMATLGISSFIAVAAMFGAGIAGANLIVRRR